MESVQELRTRIEELSLDHNGPDALQLTAAADPVARLPYEISSEIFLQCLPSVRDREPQAGAHHIPMLLLNICSAWTAIALSTPALWTSIQIVFPCAERFAQLLSLWFRRAAYCPMSICLRGDFRNLNHDVLDVIWQHGARLRHLELCDDGDWDISGEGSSNIGGFENATPGPLPALETLIVRSLVWDGAFPGSKILELLRLAPNLVECVFDRMQLDKPFDATSGKIVLPTLRRLIFVSETHPVAETNVLCCLTSPALEFLCVPGYASDVLFFLEDSAPPIRSLFLDNMNYELMDSLQLYQCLYLLPGLTQLEMYEVLWYHVADLLEWLADCPSLPDLTNLTISSIASAFDPSWSTLLRVLSTRRIELRFTLFEDDDEDSVKEPPADVLSVCRELVKDGAQIYIGTLERNFIVA